MTLRYQNVSVGSQTVSPPLPLDVRANPFSCAFVVVVSAGATLTYKVQSTLDDVFDPAYDPASGTWVDHATVTGQTTTQAGNYAYPVNAIRLNVTAWTVGTAKITVNQGQFS